MIFFRKASVLSREVAKKCLDLIGYQYLELVGDSIAEGGIEGLFDPGLASHIALEDTFDQHVTEQADGLRGAELAVDADHLEKTPGGIKGHTEWMVVVFPFNQVGTVFVRAHQRYILPVDRAIFT